MNKSNIRNKKFSVGRKFSIRFIVELSVISTLLVAISISYIVTYLNKNQLGQTICAILLIITSLLGLITGIIHSIKFNKDIDLKEHEIVEQIDEFTKGRITLKYPKDEREVLGYLQGEISKSISHFSSPLHTDDEESFNYLSNELIPIEKFEKLLISWIGNNPSAKSALILTKIDGDEDYLNIYIERLKKVLPDYFGQYIISAYDAHTLILYVLNVDNINSLEERCKRLVLNSSELFVSNYTESNILYTLRVAGAVYPYVNATTIYQTALEELNKNEDVSINRGELSINNAGNLKSGNLKTSSYLESYETFSKSFNDSTNYGERLNTVNDFIVWFTNNSTFNGGGILLSDDSGKSFRLVFESTDNKETNFFSGNENKLNPEIINKVYELGKNDPFYVCYNTKTLSKELSLFFQNLGINSVFVSIFALNNDQIGIVYMVGSNPTPYITSSDLQLLITYTSMCTKLVITLLEENNQISYNSTINKLLKRQNQYLVTVDKNTHYVTYISDNLKSKFKKLNSTVITYEELFNLDNNSKDIQIIQGTEKKIIPVISSLECTVSNLYTSGPSNEFITLLIEEKNDNLVTPQNRYLYNEELMIKNNRALVVALGKELKSANNGYILSCRLMNMEKALAIKDASEKLVMTSIIQSIENLGYGDVLYQLDDTELSFMLTGFNKKDVYYFVEEIALEVGKIIPIGTRGFEPKFCWSLISYPLEINIESRLIPLAKGELDRSEQFGIGYLAEIGNKNPRRALRNEYIEDTINKALKQEYFPINVQPIIRTTNNRIKYANIFFRLEGIHNDKLDPNEFIPIAEKTRRTVALDLAAFKSGCQLYAKYGKDIFSKLGLEGLVMYISKQSVKSNSFLNQVKKLLDKYNVPAEFFHFEIGANTLKNKSPEVIRFIDGCKELKIELDCADFDNNIIKFDDLIELGISTVKTKNSLIWNASRVDADYLALSRIVDEGKRKNIMIFCGGIETKEELDIASSLGVNLVSGYFIEKPQDEESFVAYLNFKQ